MPPLLWRGRHFVLIGQSWPPLARCLPACSAAKCKKVRPVSVDHCSFRSCCCSVASFAMMVCKFQLDSEVIVVPGKSVRSCRGEVTGQLVSA